MAMSKSEKERLTCISLNKISCIGNTHLSNRLQIWSFTPGGNTSHLPGETSHLYEGILKDVGITEDELFIHNGWVDPTTNVGGQRKPQICQYSQLHVSFVAQNKRRIVSTASTRLLHPPEDLPLTKRLLRVSLQNYLCLQIWRVIIKVSDLYR